VHELVHGLSELDTLLPSLVAELGAVVYGLLFLVVFLETGLVVLAPFLPSDSLVFVAGALAAGDLVSGWPAVLSLYAAAVCGDTLNYALGRVVGSRVLESRMGRRAIPRSQLERTRRLFARYGPRLVMGGRFVPVVRSLTPFVAGASRMRFGLFVACVAPAALVWVLVFFAAGFVLGELPWVHEHLGVTVAVIAAATAVPALISIARTLARDRERDRT
jgi:membrane-associated protein